MDRVIALDNVSCFVDRGNGVMESALPPGCVYNFQLHKDMESYLRGDAPIDSWSSTNLVTNEGKNFTNNAMFYSTAKIATWYVVIFESNTTPLVSHTYASPGYTECTAYDETVRPTYVSAASSSQVITNVASRAVFTINASKTIYGAALVGGGSSPTVKGNTAGGGTLYSSSLFSSSKAVVATNILSVDISITQS